MTELCLLNIIYKDNFMAKY